MMLMGDDLSDNEFVFDGKNFFMKQGGEWLQLSNCYLTGIKYNNNFGHDGMGSVEISVDLVANGDIQTITEPPKPKFKKKKIKLVSPKQMGRILDL